jgi:diacylglycerol kinase (ATP)
MRAAAIFGPGASSKHLRPFREASDTVWLAELPARSREADAILILGGDGTVHRHLTELVRLHLPVLIVSCGSGNDFARALGLRKMRDSVAAWRAFAEGDGRVKAIDLGVIRPFAGSEAEVGAARAPREHYFCTVGGIGLGSEVARRANRLPRWLLARGGYALCLPRALPGFQPFVLKISAEDSEGEVPHHAKPAFLAAFGNTPAYGGGMKITPRAQLDDGLLDLCMVGQMNKLKLLSLFPTVYFGRHLGVHGVEYFQAKQLRVETEQAMDVYADGEYVCRTPVEIGVASQALRVILPA